MGCPYSGNSSPSSSSPSAQPPPGALPNVNPHLQSEDMPQLRHVNLTYGSYLKVPELLELQTPLSVPAHHDELLFIISHQVYELWFKQMLHDLHGVCEHLDSDEPLKAVQLLDRVHKIQNLLIEQIPLLETMFSTDFAKFRDNLRPASGFQSVQFRKVEFLLGAKNPRILDLVGDDDAARQEMAKYLAVPTPYDHFVAHLAREDHGRFHIPESALKRNTGLPHELNPEMVKSLATLYKAPYDKTLAVNERYWPQFVVAEALLTVEEKMSIWRFHHVKMVERMIGFGGGTGGSSGAKYLRQTLEAQLYPDLWAVRTSF